MYKDPNVSAINDIEHKVATTPIPPPKKCPPVPFRDSGWMFFIWLATIVAPLGLALAVYINFAEISSYLFSGFNWGWMTYTLSLLVLVISIIVIQTKIFFNIRLTKVYL